MNTAILPAVVDRLQRAWNTREVEAVVACFHPDYESIHPFHPERNFWGAADMRRCWQATFESVPDFQAELCRCALNTDTVWTEWLWRGTHRGGQLFRAGGLMVFGLEGGLLRWARVYTETFQCLGPDFDVVLDEILSRPSAER